MDRRPEGSSVDNDDDAAGNQPTGHLSPKDPKCQKMADEPNLQAAGWNPLTPQACRTRDVEVGEEVKDNYQPEEMNTEPSGLTELTEEMSKCLKYAVDEEHLKDCIKTTSTNPGELLLFFRAYNDGARTPDGGEKNYSSSVVSAHQAKGSSSSSGSFWRPATVRVFLHVTGQTLGAHDVILERLTTKWVMKVETTSRWQESDIIIVFCPIISRVGSDVAAAMRNVTGNKPVILVLMHHTLNVDYSTDASSFSETYQNVVLDVHVLFHETLQGLLACRKNHEAVVRMQKVLSKHSKFRW